MSDIKNPSSVRATIQTVHDSYAAGDSMFPSMRLRVPVERLPRRSQHAGRLLTMAWRQIDADDALFSAALQASVEEASAATDQKSWLIALGLGRNAVNFAHVLSGEDGPKVSVRVWGREEFLKGFSGEYQMSDGRTVVLGKEVQGQPDALIIGEDRDSEAGLFVDGDTATVVNVIRRMGLTPLEVAALLPLELED